MIATVISHGYRSEVAGVGAIGSALLFTLKPYLINCLEQSLELR